ncbi:MAG: glycogen debranching N-terminal domain-containing protein [Hyphomonadaceae bacterium]
MSNATQKLTPDASIGVDVDALDVPAEASLQEQRPRTMKHGDTFAVFDHNGDILTGRGSPEGLFHGDTRHLSHLWLSLDGKRPMLLRSNLRDDNAALICDLTNPDMHDAGGKVVLRHNRIHIRRVRVLWNGAACERISIRNFDSEAHTARLSIGFGADFADIFEVRGAVRARRGRQEPTSITRDSAKLSYTGLDHRLRETHIRFAPQPNVLATNRADYVLTLQPGETRVVFMDVACDALPGVESPRRAFFTALMGARRGLRASLARAVDISTSNEIMNESLRRGVSDLYMLCTTTQHGLYPYAGIPWFSTVFGRDALITALQTLWFDPSIAAGVLKYLAANQATQHDAGADAEPGKILHEVRHSEMAELGEVPFRRYYGSVDSTPLFVLLAGAYLQRTDDFETIRALAPNIDAALAWIENHGDRDHDGFVEYYRQTDAGLANQGWKDSHDSIFHADGRLAKGPIALAEVQAYVYAAWRTAADIARRLGDAERGRILDIRADAFRRRFDAAFFDEQLGTYALALDGDKRPCRVRSSNAGHILFAHLALPERAPVVARTLMASFTGFGIRTIAASEARYNPMSYHNGSIWPHDNSIIAAGLAQYGFQREAAQIFAGLFDASIYMDLRRLPELFCGFPRQRGAGPVYYPVACSPQAWATAAPLLLLQASLGLRFEPRAKRIVFNRPALPNFMDEVTLRGLRVGADWADVMLKRAGEHVVVQVLERSDACEVVTSA